MEKQERGSSEGYLIHVTLAARISTFPVFWHSSLPPTWCGAGLRYTNTKREATVHLNGIVLPRWSSSAEDAADSVRSEPALVQRDCAPFAADAVE